MSEPAQPLDAQPNPQPSQAPPVRPRRKVKPPWIAIGFLIFFTAMTLLGIIMNQRETERAPVEDAATPGGS